MSLALDQKEDFRVRMADLEKKLTESEEERCRLEKTCNVLMRAFKEEEKMRYKALNKKYEKFLEDCTIRRRRNDIILRSLCRIEDRSKVLFAKTERLKLLKDRYISYLKVNDVKKDGFQPWKSFPSQKTAGDVTPKLIQWKTPLAAYEQNLDVRDLLSKNGTFHSGTTFDVTNNDRKGQFRSDAQEKNSGLHEQLTRPFSHVNESGYQKTLEKFTSDASSKRQDLSDAFTLRERSVISHQESIEKLKKSLMSEEDNENSDERHDPYNIIEKDRTEQSEKKPVSEQNKSHDELIPIINRNLVISSPIPGFYKEKHEIDQTSQEVEVKPDTPVDKDEEKVSDALPKGLDGVDYENETYPESYYEQPEHHNHVSIASDVILEEDETEQDLEEADSFGHRSGTWVQSPERRTFNEPEPEKQMAESDKGRLDEEVRSQRSESGGEEQKTDRPVPGNSHRSNLIHLLESDSESFQIEHGDAVSGNDDSEFDFSFGKN